MCIRDPINKTCCKNGKDLSIEAPNIKLWNHTKKTHFPVFAKNFRRPWMKLKIFFCQFPNPWTLRVSGMGGYTSKCEKNQNHCTLLQRRRSGAISNDSTKSIAFFAYSCSFWFTEWLTLEPRRRGRRYFYLQSMYLRRCTWTWSKSLEDWAPNRIHRHPQ